MYMLVKRIAGNRRLSHVIAPCLDHGTASVGRTFDWWLAYQTVHVDPDEIA